MQAWFLVEGRAWEMEEKVGMLEAFDEIVLPPVEWTILDAALFEAYERYLVASIEEARLLPVQARRIRELGDPHVPGCHTVGLVLSPVGEYVRACNQLRMAEEEWIRVQINFEFKLPFFNVDAGDKFDELDRLLAVYSLERNAPAIVDAMAAFIWENRR